MTNSPIYKLSFTTGGLLAREAALTATLYLELQDWAAVRSRLSEENLLQSRTVSSATRVGREVVQRVGTLSHDEIVLLADATTGERVQLMWAAACRQYSFIAEFAEEVLREKFLLLAPKLTHDDFDSFVRSKSLWHEELTELTNSTLKKLRSNLFRMLREAELVSDAGHILPCVLSSRVADALANRTPSDIRFFPIAFTAAEGPVR